MRIAIFIPSLAGGGAERVMAVLARGFAERGHDVDLLLAQAKGPYLSLLPAEVKVIDLQSSGTSGCVFKLRRYLKDARPAVLYSAMSHANVVALIANRLAGSPCRVVVSERVSFVEFRIRYRGLRERMVRLLMRFTYPWAHRVVTVAKAIVDELEEGLGLDRTRLVALPNPVVGREIYDSADDEPDCASFREGRPVILGAGRLSFQKDFETLIKAFSLLRQHVDANLVIIGDGPDRARLEALVEQCGLVDHVVLPGFAANPFAFMRAADLFVLSSRYEGLPGVLIQAMACGTPVVSTDCRTGAREILEDGRWGMLVPIEDSAALALAMRESLHRASHPDVRLRANDFSEARSVEAYLAAGDVPPAADSDLAKPVEKIEPRKEHVRGDEHQSIAR